MKDEEVIKQDQSEQKCLEDHVAHDLEMVPNPEVVQELGGASDKQDGKFPIKIRAKMPQLKAKQISLLNFRWITH